MDRAPLATTSEEQSMRSGWWHWRISGRKRVALDAQRLLALAQLKTVAKVLRIQCADLQQFAMGTDLHAGSGTFVQQHVEHIPCRMPAEQLGMPALFVFDGVAFDQADEVPL